MSALTIVRLILGTLFLIIGILVFLIEIFGIYKFKYVLNRIHAAAMGDTMGIFFTILGLCFFSGFNYTTAKLVLVLIFFWLSSPVASHMTALLESYTNYKLSKHLSYEGDLETLEARLKKEAKEDTK